ncbi:hypothetical protein HY524_00100 [Candidatus Berkelbacteria bacterium]|nr:hypothetical protein [Candidatus Berkelbacteria bacterium]
MKTTSRTSYSVLHPPSQMGYTLLEVLISSAMFVAVLVIATGTFTTANRLRERTRDIQQTTETARFLLETIARDIRASTGTKVGTGYNPPPFDFLQSTTSLHALGSNGLLESSALKTVRFDSLAAQTVERVYRFSVANGGDLVLQKGIAAAQSLVPDGFDVIDGHFRGVSHAVSPLRTQPFVQIELTVVHTQSGVKQTVRTLVTSRELSASGL